MASKKCPKCGRDVLEEELTCPSCGLHFASSPNVAAGTKRKKVKPGLIVLIFCSSFCIPLAFFSYWLTVLDGTKRGEEAKVSAAISDVSTFENLLEQFRLDMGRYPTTEEGIYALRNPPDDDENWRGPYTIKEIPLDPWGNEYHYEYLDGEDRYILMSFGADGVDGGEGYDADNLGSAGPGERTSIPMPEP